MTEVYAHRRPYRRHAEHTTRLAGRGRRRPPSALRMRRVPRRSRPFRLASVPAALASCLVVAAYPTLAVAPKTTRVSISSGARVPQPPSAIHLGRRLATLRSTQARLQPRRQRRERTPDVFVRDRQRTHDGARQHHSRGPGGEGASAFHLPDGRYVALPQRRPNLVAGDTNGTWDVFVRDRQSRRDHAGVAISSRGAQGESRADTRPSISADGRYVAFERDATNLVARRHERVPGGHLRARPPDRRDRARQRSARPQSRGKQRLLPASRHDLRRRTLRHLRERERPSSPATRTASLDRLRARPPSTGPRRAAFASVTKERAQESNSRRLPLSGDGRYVAFESSATNLVAGDTNATSDIFVRDRPTSTTTACQHQLRETRRTRRRLAVDLGRRSHRRLRVRAPPASSPMTRASPPASSCATARQAPPGQVSISSAGDRGNGDSDAPSISADGPLRRPPPTATSSPAAQTAPLDLEQVVGLRADRLADAVAVLGPPLQGPEDQHVEGVPCSSSSRRSSGCLAIVVDSLRP